MNYYAVKIATRRYLMIGGAIIIYNGSAWSIVYENGAPRHMLIDIFGTETTTNQIKNIIAGAPGQFFTGVILEDETEKLAQLYERGDKTGLQKITELLEMGSDDKREMEARVDDRRRLIVRARPPKHGNGFAQYVVDAHGEIKLYSGQAVSAGMNPVGNWAKISSALRVSSIDDRVYITRAEWRDGKFRVYWDV